MSALPPPGGSPPPPPPPPPPGGGGFPPPPPFPGAQPPPQGGWAQPASGQAPIYANFGQRLGAWLIDSLIIGAIVVAGFVFFGVLVASLPREALQPCTDLDGRRAFCEPLTDGSIAVTVILGLALVVAGLVFMIYFWYGKLGGQRGQTPGKMAVNIRIVGRDTYQPVGMARGIGRGLMAGLVSSNVCFLGYLWMLWDDKSQTWHDKVAESIVIVDR